MPRHEWPAWLPRTEWTVWFVIGVCVIRSIGIIYMVVILVHCYDVLFDVV